eukprot:TRINITY_DN51248_c0_g1_i1.p1 TRINITY_DN51248_c0_g1~~TRINITY_DN51248_c0_g1_i1.p1  ORF type:complete len:352 (+),score=27.21 TRINITY_DN51248_c0_g1_i1:94-1056(+)
MAALRRAVRRLSTAAAAAGPADHSPYQFVAYVGTSKLGWKGVIEHPNEGVSFVVSGNWRAVGANNEKDKRGFKPFVVVAYLIAVLSKVWKKTEAATRGRVLIYTTPPVARAINLMSGVHLVDLKKAHDMTRTFARSPFISIEARSIFQEQNPADGGWDEDSGKPKTCIVPFVYPPPNAKGPETDPPEAVDVQCLPEASYPSLRSLLVDARDSVAHEPLAEEFATAWYEIFPNCSKKLLSDSRDVLHVLERQPRKTSESFVLSVVENVAPTKGNKRRRTQGHKALCLRQKVDELRERREEKSKRKRERRAKRKAEMKANAA